jgi:hypothetical protein
MLSHPCEYIVNIHFEYTLVDVLDYDYYRKNR